ncbi:MAG: SDR family NAD(P)-dependent oxidoreductase [Lachnospiraceae bacterium]|nr:SDR family NAD(P)-dependent oxidoreductase [Lachnospiraceae bacterium]
MHHKIALITGASSGMGRECVLQIAAKYPELEELWVIARRADRLEALEEMVGNMVVRALPLDLTQKKDLQKLEKQLAEEQPDVCIAVIAAGRGNYGNFADLDFEDIRTMVRLNDESYALTTHLVLPYLSQGSQLILFASSAAFLPQPGFGVYAASKSFALSLARTLHYELRCQGIHVTAVCPGPVRTEFFDIACEGMERPAYKDRFMVEARDVVALALKDAARNKQLSIYSAAMKGLYFASKVIPHRWILSFMCR